MELERLTCSSCGAGLQVPAGIEVVNCRHCGSSLKVQRTDSVVFTELLQSVKQQTDRLEQTTELLKIQNDILQLDRDWDLQSEKLMIRGKHGHTSPPSLVGAIFIGTVGTGFGVFWTTLVATSGAPSFMVGFGMLFIGVAIVSSIAMFVKSIKYKELQRDYDQRRDELQRRMRSVTND